MLPFISFIGNLASIPLKSLFRKACLVKLVRTVPAGGDEGGNILTLESFSVLRFPPMVPSEAR